MMRHLFYSQTSSPLSCLRRPNHHLLLLFSSHRGSHSVSRRQREEEESRLVRVSVWWDFENCGVPSGVNVFRISAAITAAVRSTGIKGPVEITAFGDMLQLSRLKQEGLSSTGINLTHIPRGGKNSTDRSLLVSLMHWVSQNPPPAHLFLISGDRDFASILHRLRMSNYNILLAIPESAHGVLCSAASIMWNWQDLLRGESHSAKYFNQPPDSPHGSWYGHYYKVPLSDPFVSEESPETSPDEKAQRLVPEVVVNRIRGIVESSPNGIAMAELRNELVNSGSFDKDYYGHKKFISFLLSLENVVKIKLVKDSHYVVFGVGRNRVGYEGRNKSVKESEENAIGVDKESEEKIVETLGDGEKVLEMDNEPKPESESESEKENVETVGGLESSRDLAHAVVERRESSSENGFFGRFWTKLFRGESSGSDNKGYEGEVKSEGKDLEKDSNPSLSSEAFSDDKPVTKRGLLERIRNWFKSSSDADIINDLGHEIFSQDSFWSTMESFMDSSQGSLLVSESRTREHMAREFQRKGPECLHSLGENDLLHLVELLISDKKWVEEFPSENFPFKLTRATKSQPLKTGPSTTVNSLSSLFQSQSPQPGTKRPRNLDKQGKNGNTEEKPRARSREEVLSDCRNLVNELLKEHPNGYFAGLFRKQFCDRYGYRLDFQKLGYRHLAALLSTLPGVKLKSGHIVPCDKALSGQENFSYGIDALWEELGPVASTKSSKPDEEVVDFDLEAAISEDEISDSDEAGHINIIQKKPKFENEDDNNNINNNSSLLRILDSWHCRNEGGLCKNKSEFAMQDWSHRPKKSYSFVLDSGSDENNDVDKLANGVLGNLRTPNELPKIEKDKVLCE